MKRFILILTLALFYLAACTNANSGDHSQNEEPHTHESGDHTHEEGADHTHDHAADADHTHDHDHADDHDHDHPHEQEEFAVEADTLGADSLRQDNQQ